MTAPKYVLLATQDGAETSGDTLSEIVDQLIPEHADAPDAERVVLRHDVLASLATQAQVVVTAAVAKEDPDAFSSLDEDELTVLFHDRGTERVAFEAWNSTIPLFLVSTAYSPFTETEKPEGEHIVFLDPTNERTFLDSLKLAGAAELLVRDDTDDEIDAAFA